MKRSRSTIAAIGAYLATVGLMLAAAFAVTPAPASAQTNPLERGPVPSNFLGRGSFATSRADVSGFGAGYNNVTICYPNTTGQTFGGVVVMPGFISSKSQMMWSCDKIASYGFVVAVAETTTVLDFPAQRAAQQQAIIRHLSGTGAPAAVRQRLDTQRWACAGWSMGGGGSLDCGRANNPRVEAVVGWEPWNISSYGTMQVPSLVVTGSADFVASASMGRGFYTSIPATTPKYYVNISGAGHFTGTQDNAYQSAATIAWLKRWVDNDTRFDRFLCPAYSGGGAQIEQNCGSWG
jgi:dienelactone hydrolase